MDQNTAVTIMADRHEHETRDERTDKLTEYDDSGV